MNVIGVDPGLQGGLALLRGDDVPVVIPMPIVRGGKGARDQYDVDSLRARLAVWSSGPRPRVVIERLQPLPGKFKRKGGKEVKAGGTIANYNRGLAQGLLVGICSTLGISYELVSPRTWQREMLAGTSGADTKQRSILAAGRLFPGVSLRPTERSRKASDGMADALLIAAYGQRRLSRVWEVRDARAEA